MTKKKTGVETLYLILKCKEKGKLKANPKETTLQPKQRRRRRPRERETHTLGLGKRKMEEVTNDLTDRHY